MPVLTSFVGCKGGLASVESCFRIPKKGGQLVTQKAFLLIPDPYQQRLSRPAKFILSQITMQDPLNLLK